MEKLPQVWCSVLSRGDRGLASDGWKLQGGSVVVVEQVSEVGGGFVSEEKDLESDPLWDSDHVEALEDRGCVVKRSGCR